MITLFKSNMIFPGGQLKDALARQIRELRNSIDLHEFVDDDAACADEMCDDEICSACGRYIGTYQGWTGRLCRRCDSN